MSEESTKSAREIGQASADKTAAEFEKACEHLPAHLRQYGRHVVDTLFRLRVGIIAGAPMIVDGPMSQTELAFVLCEAAKAFYNDSARMYAGIVDIENGSKGKHA